jgi:hypothetical protein
VRNFFHPLLPRTPLSGQRAKCSNLGLANALDIHPIRPSHRDRYAIKMARGLIS